MSVLGFDVGGEWVGPGAQDVGGFLVQGVVGGVFSGCGVFFARRLFPFRLGG